MLALSTPLLALVLALAPVNAYKQGNTLYAQKDYVGAARAYEQALDGGPNAAVYYNLGNAQFKAGQIGRAILSYRRARYLDPRDPDIRTNLVFARNYRVDKVLTVPSPFARALDRGFHWLSRREATVLAALFFTLAALALAFWIVRRWAFTLVAAVLFAVVALFCFITQQVWTSEVNAQPAVVVAPEVDALSGPGDEFKPILLLHDGTEVRVRETRGDHVLVQLPGGSGGWIKKEAIERVYPQHGAAHRPAPLEVPSTAPPAPLAAPATSTAAPSGSAPGGARDAGAPGGR